MSKKPAPLIETVRTIAADVSSMRVLIAAVSVVVMAIVMVGVQVVARVDHLERYANLMFWIEAAAGVSVIFTVGRAGPLALREMSQRRLATASAVEARLQVERLFQMTDMLQSAMDYADANAVLLTTAHHLLPGFGGALYVFNNSRDRLDLSVSWAWPADKAPPQTVAPAHCWALKRGRPHMNPVGETALRCTHHDADLVVLEIPMMARGEVYGLLNVLADTPEALARIAEIRPLASAIADGMSLALSNITLREKLRTQALRDPLTSLYNRRYMEDALERYVSLAERNGSGIAAIMIDLDHFKRLNDEFGHAFGDSVLREVATAITGSIRQCDVACRYGGEELVVLLPDCALGEALAKAEMIRLSIEALSEVHGARITASLGVAAVPETSAKGGDLLAMADAALYRAKQEGRNRVQAAPRRAAAHLPMAAE